MQDASHALRTPITIARGHLDLVAEDSRTRSPGRTSPSRSSSSTGWAPLRDPGRARGDRVGPGATGARSTSARSSAVLHRRWRAVRRPRWLSTRRSRRSRRSTVAGRDGAPGDHRERREAHRDRRPHPRSSARATTGWVTALAVEDDGPDSRCDASGCSGASRGAAVPCRDRVPASGWRSCAPSPTATAARARGRARSSAARPCDVVARGGGTSCPERVRRHLRHV